METDGIETARNRFYFLHCFDAHYPYLPPAPLTDELSIDHTLGDRLLDAAKMVNNGPLRTDLTLEDVGLTAAELEQVKQYYDASTRHVADQLTRLFSYLEQTGALEDAFIIIAGDHGEEFLERGTFFHTSLYDRNIRPWMAVKPPAESQFTVPDAADLLSVFPTIADLVSGTVPDHCCGRSWLGEDTASHRIAERLTEEQYNISVELEGNKGIFTYSVDSPTRPSDDTDAEVEEFYEPASVREEQDSEVDTAIKNALRDRAHSFIRTETGEATTAEQNLPADVTDRLEQLGYR
jgi:arylsulfatase A-like enzyme